MAITTSDIAAALAIRGLSLPTSEIDGILCLLDKVMECITTNYPDECTQNAIITWAAILMASSSNGRFLSSHTAPSGASESFKYGSTPWVSLYNQLRALDTANCTGSIVTEPEGISGIMFGVVRGYRSCRNDFRS
ncbi:MAG: hypothetical protein J6N68_07480 [Shewanella sp.]|nr:hypothetical protein [Shewanella sp.]